MFQPWVESLNFEFKFSVKNTTSVLRFVWFCCSGGVPLVLPWYSVGIMECSAGLLGNVQLLRHCSGVFRCSIGVLRSVFPCSGVPGFKICRSLWCSEILKRWILRLAQEKMMGFDYCEEYVRSTSNKILLRQC